MQTSAAAASPATLPKRSESKPLSPEALEKLLPPPPAGLERLRQDSLFTTEHPVTDTYVSAHGETLPVQFQDFSLDSRSISGTASIQKVEKYLEGTGLKAIRTTTGKALIALLFNDHQDASTGPYQNANTMVFATRSENAAPIAFKDAWSSIVPLLDPQTVLVAGPYAMAHNTGALDIGRELLGLNKYETNLTIESPAGINGTVASIKNTNGKEVIGVGISDATVLDGFRALKGMISNLGLLNFLKLAMAGRKAMYHQFVGHDPKSTVATETTDLFIRTAPKTRAWSANDTLKVQPGSPLSDYLIDMEFEPVLVGREKNTQAVLEPDRKTAAKPRAPQQP